MPSSLILQRCHFAFAMQLSEKGYHTLQHLAGFCGPPELWAVGGRPGTSERHLSRATSASSASMRSSNPHIGRGSGEKSLKMPELCKS